MLYVLLLGIFVLLSKAFTAFQRALSPFNEVIRTSVGDGLIMNAILTLINADLCKKACADPGIFVRGGGGGGGGAGGGPGQSDKKSSNNVFFLFFGVFFSAQLNYSTEVKWWSISKKSIIFQGSRGGPTFSRGGPTFSRGGGGGPIAYSLYKPI